MDRFLIITNEEKDKDNIITNKIAAYIEKAGKQVLLSRVSSFRNKCESGMITKEIQCAIVLGGDGTIIHAANDLMAYHIPILGVNLGTVGFLAEIEVQNVYEALDHLFDDKFEIEKRLMIKGDAHINGNGQTEEKSEFTEYALNDIVITRKGISRIISLGIYVNDELVDNFRGDGVIISTPTGSTAYNLSAGGPIVIPKANIMVITPICPHSLSLRSIVVSAEDTIKIVIGKSKKTQEAEAIVTFDGNKVMDLGTDDVLYVNKAEYGTNLIKLNRTSIYEILRSKLGSNE